MQTELFVDAESQVTAAGGSWGQRNVAGALIGCADSTVRRMGVSCLSLRMCVVVGLSQSVKRGYPADTTPYRSVLKAQAG